MNIFSRIFGTRNSPTERASNEHPKCRVSFEEKKTKPSSAIKRTKSTVPRKPTESEAVLFFLGTFGLISDFLSAGKSRDAMYATSALAYFYQQDFENGFRKIAESRRCLNLLSIMPAISFATDLNGYLKNTLAIDESTNLSCHCEHSLENNEFFLRLDGVEHSLFTGSCFTKKHFSEIKKILSIKESEFPFKSGALIEGAVLFLIGTVDIVMRLLEDDKPKEAAFAISILIHVWEKHHEKAFSSIKGTQKALILGTVNPLKHILISLRINILDYGEIDEPISCTGDYTCKLSTQAFNIKIDGTVYQMFKGMNLNSEYLHEIRTILNP